MASSPPQPAAHRQGLSDAEGPPFATTASVTTNPAPVPDVLLSLAESQRHASVLSDMLGDLIAPYLPATQSLSTSAQSIRSALGPEIDLLASILHAILVLWRDGRTLGMEAMDLRHASAPSATKSADGKPDRKAMAKAEANPMPPPPPPVIIHPRPGLESPYGSGAAGSTFSARPSSLPAAIGSSARAAAFVILCAAPRYLVERAGRGGWGDLGEALNTARTAPRLGVQLSAADASGPGATAAAPSFSNERLRGEARRQAFKEQRRRAAAVARADAAERRIRPCEGYARFGDRRRPFPIGESGGDGRAPEGGDRSLPRRSDEPVEDGSERRGEVYQGRISGFRIWGHMRMPLLRAALRAVWRRIWLLSRQASLALRDMGPEAHGVPSNPWEAGAVQGTAVLDDGEYNNAIHWTTSALRWALRLHLALFYMNGRFPTLAHRLVGVSLHTAGGKYEVSRIVSERPNYRIVGVLIVLQAGAALARAALLTTIEAVHAWRLARERGGGGPFRGGQSSLERDDGRDDAAARDRCVAAVECSVPSAMSLTVQSPDAPLSLSRTQCGICMNPRTHPAASIKCGHVFCWDCLQRWMSSVRQECPLCRVPAKPNDVLPLYHF